MGDNPVAQVRSVRLHGPDKPVARMMHLWCPGCDSLHGVYLEGPDGYRPDTCWEWDGDLERPTVTPSILVHSPRCHSFVRTGQWVFLTDSEHSLAGQTVDLVPLPDWMVG